ncbi:hypothetical protein LCGC14_2987730 [marine sediment metagenome]|uniref:CBS domain-containing protein n=1 Tax=marine sediment metagenome TaxID=412755 RepID=A0A0F8XSA9_9ZZZZ
MRCFAEATEGHHAFFGRRWRAYWELLVNENYYIALCSHHHRYDVACPHKDDDRFFGLIKEEKLVGIVTARDIVDAYQRDYQISNPWLEQIGG